MELQLSSKEQLFEVFLAPVERVELEEEYRPAGVSFEVAKVFAKASGVILGQAEVRLGVVSGLTLLFT